MLIVKYIYNLGVHAHLLKCWRSSWSEKGWDSLHYLHSTSCTTNLLGVWMRHSDL